jgi:preprotein translocase subunit SecG
MIENLLLIVHLVMAVALVVLVLLQQGKGAQAGAAFGGGGSSGSSQSLFGARGSANFLTRTTAVIATIFFVTTLSLAYLYANRSGSSSVVSKSVVEQIEEVQESDVPMVPADAPAEESDTQSDIPAVPE